MKVSGIKPSLEFYCDLLGFEITTMYELYNEDGTIVMYSAALDLEDLLNELK